MVELNFPPRTKNWTPVIIGVINPVSVLEGPFAASEMVDVQLRRKTVSSIRGMEEFDDGLDHLDSKRDVSNRTFVCGFVTEICFESMSKLPIAS